MPIGKLEGVMPGATLQAREDLLVAENATLRAAIARLRELKTPASRELLNITKALLDEANENERLRGEVKHWSEHESEAWLAMKAELDSLRAVLKDCLTVIEELWGAVGSPPHLLDQIRAVLGVEQSPQHGSAEGTRDSDNREP